ncbi:MAG: hypothetical protein J5525_13330 [Lachnospiraceae bacterium]|nr:hypothetical protein [Lachnospiraceae bacterium]
MAKNQEVKKWIIGMSGSEWDDVCVYSFEGTKSQAKKVLVDLVKSDKKEFDNYDYGTEKVSEIEEDKFGVLHAGTTFSDCHNDYTATPMEAISDISTRHWW